MNKQGSTMPERNASIGATDPSCAVPAYAPVGIPRTRDCVGADILGGPAVNGHKSRTWFEDLVCSGFFLVLVAPHPRVTGG